MIRTGETEIPFDDFASQCDLVESYFGEAIDDVALYAPVSKPQLVAVLARAQVTGRERTPERLADRGEVVYRSSHESMWLLEPGFWDDVRDEHHLRLDERRAARAVHHRVLEAVVDAATVPSFRSRGADSKSVPGTVAAADRNHRRDPFVLVTDADP
ncbi:hypothetical protein [Natrarchaeobaculum aegyptiacum]|uniref:DUF8048 domain-containing protein n=1 Tax=Natrarchaeobaculum aegyptiacum TaxID=745377 RepID=A0A2Z2HZR4_9EURY|nr:hypothetical protein [Natrarchaeobaculum aegyptiacum]ARS91527.1 hypothetical protein B1756_18580 [Natrarchaeobaculum aegyptiacum]